MDGKGSGLSLSHRRYRTLFVHLIIIIIIIIIGWRVLGRT